MDSSRIQLNGSLVCVLYGKKILPSERDSVNMDGRIIRSENPPSYNIRIPFLSKEQKDYSFKFINGVNMPNPSIVGGRGGLWDGMRGAFSGFIDKYDYWGQNGLLKAFLFGDRNSLPASAVNDFTAAGIAHLIAVSGLNVGILVLAFSFVLGLFGVSGKVRFMVISVFVFLYAGLCGFDPPVTRASLMVFCAMSIMLAGIGQNFESLIFTALFVVLVFDPAALFGASLQLSFASVWGLGVFYPHFALWINSLVSGKGFLRKIIKYVLLSFSVSLIAFVTTAPILAATFGTLPVLSILFNLPSVPLASFIVVAGMITTFMTAAGPILAPATQFMVHITGISLKILTEIASFSAGLPFSTFKIANVSLFVLIFIYLWLFMLSKVEGRPLIKKVLLYSAMLFILFYVWNPVFSGIRNKVSYSSEALFLNVGQGDSSLLKCGNGNCFLIDAGLSSQAKTVVVPWLKKMNILHLDAVFVTHMDADHAGGLDYLLNNIAADRIFCRNSVADSLRTIYGDRVTGISAGDSISFESGGALVLSPFPAKVKVPDKLFDSENEQSLVIRIDTSGKRILYTGDISPGVQQFLVPWGVCLKSQVIKIPHHGAKALREGFLGAVSPEDAVISCGLNNSYGHPAKDTIKLLEKTRIKVLRTDQQGSVSIEFPSMSVTDY